MSVENSKYLYFMLLVLLLAFALGAYGLNLDILWSDEVYTLVFLGAFHSPSGPASPAQTLSIIQELVADHVPLFYILAGWWAGITGWSQVALRYLSLLSGILMIAWLYRFTVEALDRRTAAVSSLLMASSAFVIVYFHELRAYTFLMTVAVIHCWMYWRLAHERSNSRRLWVAFILTTTILLYTHNLALVLFAALGTGHLVYVRRSATWYRIMAAWAIGALPFLPYVPLLLSGDFAYGANTRALPAVDLARALATVLSNGYVLFWLPIVLALAYAFHREPKRAVIHIALIALMICLGMFAANARFSLIPITRIRYFLIAWWLFVILISYGLTALPRWQIWTAGFILLWSLAGYFFGRSERILDYTGFVSFARTYPPMHTYIDNLRGKVKPTDYVIGFTEENWVNYDGDLRHGYSTKDYYFGLRLGIDGEFIDVNNRPWEIKRDVGNILNAYPEVLLVYDPQKHLTQVELTASTVQEVYLPCTAIVKRPDLIIQRFVHPVAGCGREATSIEYETGIKIIDYAAKYSIELQRIEALIRWHVPDVSMLDQYNMSLQLVTPEWENVRQVDRHLSAGLLPWSVSELSTAGLKAGDYRLMLVLYNRDTRERIMGMDMNSGETGKILALLGFTVQS